MSHKRAWWRPTTVRTPLPGWRRFRCGGCSYSYEQPAVAGSPMPDLCSHCGRPWVAVSEAVGNGQRVRDVCER